MASDLVLDRIAIAGAEGSLTGTISIVVDGRLIQGELASLDEYRQGVSGALKVNGKLQSDLFESIQPLQATLHLFNAVDIASGRQLGWFRCDPRQVTAFSCDPRLNVVNNPEAQGGGLLR